MCCHWIWHTAFLQPRNQLSFVIKNVRLIRNWKRRWVNLQRSLQLSAEVDRNKADLNKLLIHMYIIYIHIYTYKQTSIYIYTYIHTHKYIYICIYTVGLSKQTKNDFLKNTPLTQRLNRKWVKKTLVLFLLDKNFKGFSSSDVSGWEVGGRGWGGYSSKYLTKNFGLRMIKRLLDKLFQVRTLPTESLSWRSELGHSWRFSQPDELNRKWLSTMLAQLIRRLARHF